MLNVKNGFGFNRYKNACVTSPALNREMQLHETQKFKNFRIPFQKFRGKQAEDNGFKT